MSAAELQLAVQSGSIEVVRALIKAGANVSQRFSSGDTPLLLAIGAGKLDVMEVLLAEAKADPHQADLDDMPPIERAAMTHNCDAVKLLHRFGARLDTPYPAIVIAADQNNVPLIHLIVKELGGNVDERERLHQSKTALHAAVLQKSIDAACALITLGASVRATTEPGGETPLHLAATLERPHCDSITQVLLSAGADPNSRDYLGRTPLMRLAGFNKVSPMRHLLKVGAQLDIEMPENRHTAILKAAIAGAENAVVYLAEAGASPNTRTTDLIPLLCCVEQERVRAVEALLAAGADPNVQSPNRSFGGSALHLLIRRADAINMQATIELVQLLLACGANPNIPNGVGDTVMDAIRRELRQARFSGLPKLPSALTTCFSSLSCAKSKLP